MNGDVGRKPSSETLVHPLLIFKWRCRWGGGGVVVMVAGWIGLEESAAVAPCQGVVKRLKFEHGRRWPVRAP